MNEVRVASLACYVENGGVPEMLARADALADEACHQPTDVICFPELFAWVNLSRERQMQAAEAIDGPVVRHMSALARERHVNVVAPLIERDGGDVYNTMIWFDRSGRILGKYRKVYLPPGEMSAGYMSGPPEFEVFSTEFGPIGCCICFDINLRDVIERIAGQGAKLVLFPTMFLGRALMQAWAKLYRMYFISISSLLYGELIDPAGRVLIEQGLHGHIMTATINLDYVVMHTDGNARKFAGVKKQHGDRVQIDVLDYESCALLYSRSPEFSAADVVRECGLETEEDYFARSRRERSDRVRESRRLGGKEATESMPRHTLTPTPESRRRELLSLLGDLPDRSLPIKVSTQWTECREGYYLEKLVLDLNQIEPVPAYFVRPRDRREKLPAILYNHAHGGDYALGKEEFLRGRGELLQAPPYAEQLARLGYAALCADMWVFGERAGQKEETLFKQMLWRGQVLWGMMVYDSLRAMDYLQSRPEVDPARLGTMGLSMGSTMAWWVAALDERVKVCVDICCLTDYDALIESNQLDSHGIYYFVPRLLKHFSAHEINALIAPRPHLSLAGNLDPLTPPRGLDRIDAELKKVYAAAGASEAWKLLRYHTGHAETPEMRTEIVTFLQKWM